MLFGSVWFTCWDSHRPLLVLLMGKGVSPDWGAWVSFRVRKWGGSQAHGDQEVSLARHLLWLNPYR